MKFFSHPRQFALCIAALYVVGPGSVGIVESMTGVSSIKSGAGVSKPVVHGLSGNRVTILNNGLAQSGQQWGNDHAPEIDPYVADHISVW